MRIMLASMAVLFLIVVTLSACSSYSVPDIAKMVKSANKKK